MGLVAMLWAESTMVWVFFVIGGKKNGGPEELVCIAFIAPGESQLGRAADVPPGESQLAY
eukprot:scaffold8557_cov100-Skeletonema_dohrnii-CCMP3373.AAC.2